ncbi:ATP-grasp fold amidoligase family protein [Peribacillus frigoritolerans]|uniref:ATP-grasp fold amidoligase family protein n=1 Tax=Peribacillus frigoritolerans TaxID=450367 RepID=UPI002B05263C|nr:ATP-grasp fold amidoligase family protein [Peribacillus frigoritolerans]MEA3573928.1 ATP-grasp fold amidoligase family protein [Peribacillus frigoritolerans]
MSIRDKLKSVNIINSILAKKNYLLIKYNYMNKLKRDFKKSLGYELDLINPKTFNEKIQWLKLYYHRPILTAYADKYKVRKLIKEKIGEEYLIQHYGVYENPKDINLDLLPNQFVLKPNHGAGRIIICTDKSKMNWNKELKKMHRWMKENYFYVNGEWQYKDIKPMIICEKLLQEDIIDYKIFCFNGEPRCIQVIGNRKDGNYYSNYYNLEWGLMDIDRVDHGKSYEIVPKPLNLNKMLEISKIISSAFPFVRMDFYEVDGKIYFGETTFTPANGLIKFQPDKYDSIFGDYLKLPSETIL